MRPYPHEIDEDFLEAHFAAKRTHYLSSRRQAAMARVQKDAPFLASRQTEARQLAAMAHALGYDPKDVEPWLAEAARHGREAFDLGEAQPPFVFMTWLALALLTEDESFRETLQDVEELSTRADEIFVHAAHGMRHLAAGRDEPARTTAEAGRARAHHPDVSPDAREVAEPLLALTTAVLDKSTEALATAIEVNDAEFRNNFHEDLSIDADGLLNFIGLGLLQLARERGLEPPDQSPYLPVELLRK